METIAIPIWLLWTSSCIITFILGVALGIFLSIPAQDLEGY